MKMKEGKDFLQDCLQKCGCETDIDELIIYKVGRCKTAVEYHNDIIPGDIDFSKARPTVKYIVKCFIHLGIYAAWTQESCRGRGKCDAYKKDLVAMEQNPDWQHTETTFNKNTAVYWFRGSEGVEWFIKEKLLKE